MLPGTNRAADRFTRAQYYLSRFLKQMIPELL